VRPAWACGIIVDAIDRAQDERVGNGFLLPEIRRLNLRWFSPLVEVKLPTARLQGEWIELDFQSLPQHETASPLELR
jgi:hypothetical protein